jgi:hypothetical protein
VGLQLVSSLVLAAANCVRASLYECASVSGAGHEELAQATWAQRDGNAGMGKSLLRAVPLPLSGARRMTGARDPSPARAYALVTIVSGAVDLLSQLADRFIH